MLHRILETPEATIYVWHVTETAEELGMLLEPFRELALFDIDEEMAPKLWRHTHFLSTRYLLFNHAGIKQPIRKDNKGKPFLDDTFLSITHSNNYAAVIVSKTHEVAVDLERIDDRIMRVAHKFLHESEAFFAEAAVVTGTTLIWSAKETLYKLYGRKEVIFKEELRIRPFNLDTSGTFLGDVLKTPSHTHVQVHYQQFDGYVLTWVDGFTPTSELEL